MGNIYNCGIFLCILISLHSAYGDTLTSVPDLKQLMYAENDLAMSLTGYILAEKERLAKLEAIKDEYLNHSQMVLREPEKHLGNLVCAFSTVKRFTIDWQDTFQNLIIPNAFTQKYINDMQTTANSFPCYDDLVIAASNLFRIQDTYALEPAPMASGEVKGMTPGEHNMNAADCFELGKVAYYREDWYHAIPWMEHALYLVKSKDDSSMNIWDIYDFLNHAHFHMKNIHRARELVSEWLRVDPHCQRAKNNLDGYAKMIRLGNCRDTYEDKDRVRNLGSRRPSGKWKTEKTFERYEKLCRGEDVNLFKKDGLFCEFASWHPMFIINPLRLEWLRFDPPVRVFHQVLSESETSRIRDFATPRLTRSQVFQDKSNPNTDPIAVYRISKTAWIGDNEDPIVAKVSAKSSAITNLTLSTVEQLQVVNYGIGGHYEPHLDASRPGEKTSFVRGHGNRIATIIFYIEDVEAGGGTVFPDLGIGVQPEKGSAAVWYNLKKNGQLEDKSVHAGCPVITGNKWIATKWFHETGNEFNRKCDLDRSL